MTATDSLSSPGAVPSRQDRSSMGAGVATSGAFLPPAVLCFGLAARCARGCSAIRSDVPVVEPAA